jgi:hypothetical protein
VFLKLQALRPGADLSWAGVRILDDVDDLLFNRGELGRALELQGDRMREAVEAESEESLGQADVDEWARSLAHHFAVRCPELKLENVWREAVEDTTVDVSWDSGRDITDYGRARSFPGYRVVVHIPFEGDGNIFHLRTNTFTFNPPRGSVAGNDLIKTIEYARDTKPNIDGIVNDFTNTINQWLAWAKAQCDSFNDALEQEARRAVEARRHRITERDAHLAESSIPVGRPGTGRKTYIPDVLVRRPAPSLPESRADDKAPELEPILEEKIFEDILEKIRMHGRQMEQSPGTYASMGEEDRRQTIVGMLNTHYEGRAAAEAFNNEGKTDILIRYEARNLFICECKFWSGSADFDETINQLFRYVGWRDTKLAIVMFVREKGLTAILKKAKPTLEGHPQFVAAKKAASETELRATMRWPGDDQRLADLNIFFVHTPEPAR